MNLIPLWVHHFGKRTAWSHICQFVQFSVHKSYTARKITLLSNGNFEENMDLSCIYLAVHPTFFTALNFNGIESIPLNTTLWSLTSCKDSRLVAASQKGLGSRCFIQLAKQLAAVCFKANCKGNCHLVTNNFFFDRAIRSMYYVDTLAIVGGIGGLFASLARNFAPLHNSLEVNADLKWTIEEKHNLWSKSL